MLKKATLALVMLSIIAMAAALMLPVYIAAYSLLYAMPEDSIRSIFHYLIGFGAVGLVAYASYASRIGDRVPLYAVAFVGLAVVTLSGCSVNVVVAPHATVAVDSQNSRADLRATQTHDVYEAACLPDSDSCL